MDNLNLNYIRWCWNSWMSAASSPTSWWYQVCTEVGYFKVAYEGSIRSSEVSLNWHLDLCADVFGARTYPEVDVTNLYYGGTGIYGSKYFFLNGSQDPWRWASKQFPSPGEPLFLIECHNCGHGTDMGGCPQSPLQPRGDPSKCENPVEVMKSRQLISDFIAKWLSDPTKCTGLNDCALSDSAIFITVV